MNTSSSRSSSPRGTSPRGSVVAQFGDKAKLVSAVQALATDALWLDRVNAEKGLGKVSNAKLLRLHAALSRAQQEFGSREKLMGAILELARRSKDEGYKTRLSAYPVPRLLDLHDALSKRAPAKPAAKAAPARRVARTKKAKQKALTA